MAIIEYPFANCKIVVDTPCPNDAVASLHFPRGNSFWVAISSISKSIWLNTPIFSKNNLNLSFSSFSTLCAILTEPIFPDLIKICSAVILGGISSSYSLIGNPAQVIDFGKFKNIVSVSITPSSKPAVKVNNLKTDPSSYTPFVTLFI